MTPSTGSSPGTTSRSWRGPQVTFAVRDGSDHLEGVWLRHRVVGLPGDLALRRVPGTDLWYVVVDIPADSRVE